MTSPNQRTGFLVSAPTSGSGKTVLSLALTRALADRGHDVAAFKAGPDYIDPGFLSLAARAPARNLDPWSMTPDQIAGLAHGGTILVEGAMGLFDGAADGTGASADLAAMLDLPVLLVLDAARTSQSLAAMLRGFATHRADVRIGAVIANRVASERHGRMVRAALEPVCAELGIVLAGLVPRDARLALPSRHLGLVPAGERAEVEAFVADAAGLVASHVDLDAAPRFASTPPAARDAVPTFPPFGQCIAVARDVAHAFCYPHALDEWHAAGASVLPFSPLADEAPDPSADAVFLPGGYPELHASTLANASRFRAGMHDAARRGTFIYGECGGYMVLGDALTDADGERHAMLGLLPVETSFAERRLNLGYRQLDTLGPSPLGKHFRGHEHHHASIVREGGADRLFAVRDAEGTDLGPAGLRRDSVCGSFMHIVAVR